MIYIGIDNGVTGSIGIIGSGPAQFIKMPVKKELSYTKTKQWISRINNVALRAILTELRGDYPLQCSVAMERPMVMPGRFKATVSALRALEATLITVENLSLPYRYIDSKEWQKVMLPKGLKGEELKIASLDIAKRKYPTIDFKGFKDADGLLIAEYISRVV